jgi:hypothetical protein
MDRAADLHSARNFVIGQIAEQAERQGEPLSDEQRLLLNYLPSSGPTNWDPEITVLVPRNINLERVCALGKAAYQHDLQVNPASLDWEFAFAAFTLERHPMAGLLQWAGMKPRRARWDGLLLIGTALLPMVAIALLVLNADGGLLLSVGIVSGCVVIMLLMFLASRRIKKQRLKEAVERCRPESTLTRLVAAP